MFVIGVSYMSLLQSVATRCLLPYVSTVCEISDEKTVLYGIEIELPAPNLLSGSQFFFSGHTPNQMQYLVTKKLLCRQYGTYSLYMGSSSPIIASKEWLFTENLLKLLLLLHPPKFLLTFSYKETECPVVCLMPLSCRILRGISQRGTNLCNFLFF